VERSPELEDLVRRWYTAMMSGDISMIERLLSQEEGVLSIGSDPREWWTGYDNVVATFKAQFQEMGGQLQATPGDLRAYQEGSVGWMADNPTFRLPDGTAVPFRFTGVFHQEGGAWRCVQSHASIGVSNQQAVGRALTV
jgi:ketosteroid isomerase-like protein